MTLKQNSKAILDVIASQDAQNATQAYKEIHPTASDVTARTNAHKLLKKPEAQIYLQRHIDKAKAKVVSLVDSKREEIALKASEAILDRSLGKATVVTESTDYKDIHITLGTAIPANTRNIADVQEHTDTST